MTFFNFLQSVLFKKQIYGTIIIIFFGFVIYQIAKKIINKVMIQGRSSLETKRRKTVVVLIENIIFYVIVLVAFLMALELYGVDTKSLIAGLGIVGVVLGLALQDTVKDFIAGLFIIMDNYFVVGDYVTYNGFTGQVISLGLKTTKIKKYTGEIYTIANRNIDSIINLSQKSCNIYIEIPTAYEENCEKVEKTLKKVVEKAIKNTSADEESQYIGINELADSSIKYLINIHCPQDTQWQTRRDVLKIIKEQYEKENIKIPYNQIEVHNGKKL